MFSNAAISIIFLVHYVLPFQLLMNLMFQFICFLTYGCLVENHFVKIYKQKKIR
jgi:hypothetical protein